MRPSPTEPDDDHNFSTTPTRVCGMYRRHNQEPNNAIPVPTPSQTHGLAFHNHDASSMRDTSATRPAASLCVMGEDKTFISASGARDGTLIRMGFLVDSGTEQHRNGVQLNLKRNASTRRSIRAEILSLNLWKKTRPERVEAAIERGAN